MNVLTMHDVAGNGMTVNTSVELVDWEVERNAWRARVRVDSVPMATGHFSAPNAAKRWAEKMHGAYLETHCGEVAS